MFGALPLRIARCRTGRARPSISRNTIPGTAVSTRSPDRRAIRWVTLKVYVSSSSVPRRTSRTTVSAEASRATASADQNESSARSPSVIASAASSIRALSTSTTRNPSSATNGRRSAATTGGRSAFRIAITAAATRAEPNFLTWAPGTSPAAPSSASAATTHERSRRNGWNRGRTTSQAGCSPYMPLVLAIKGDPDASPCALLVAEPGCRRVVVHRLGLALEARQLALQVREQHVAQVVREAAPHDHAEGGEVLAVLRERVRRHLPAPLAERVRDVEDREVVDPVPHGEGEDRELVPARQQLEGPELLDLPRQPRGDVAGVSLDVPVALEAEPQEVVVLRDHLGARPREVERERRHVVAEVVDPEDQVLRQSLAVTPDDPAHAGVDEPVLVPGGVDRDDARQAEVPDEIGVDERGDERA